MRSRTRLVARSLFVLSLLVPAACGDPTGVIEEVDFDPSLGIDLASMTKLASGVYILDVEPGAGDPVGAGARLTVSYVGRLVDARVFDSGSFSFTLGSGQVIPGFDQGIDGMRPGGKRRIIIPPEQGYGNSSAGSIPPGSILIFDVELLEVA